MSDWWNEPGCGAPRSPACPWCGSPATPEATVCPNCGDSLVQREDLAGLAIPGVTTVDPALSKAQVMARETTPESVPEPAPEPAPDPGPGDPAARDPDAWWNRPGYVPVDDDGTFACPWCTALCATDALACETCGASLAESDELETLQIPGVTTVDPAIQRIGAAGQRQASGSALGVIGRTGTIGMIMGAVSTMTSARALQAERGAVDLDGPNPAIAELAEQMRAEGARAGARHPGDAGLAEASGPGTGAADPVTPENDPWRDLPSRTLDQDR